MLDLSKSCNDMKNTSPSNSIMVRKNNVSIDRLKPANVPSSSVPTRKPPEEVIPPAADETLSGDEEPEHELPPTPTDDSENPVVSHVISQRDQDERLFLETVMISIIISSAIWWGTIVAIAIVCIYSLMIYSLFTFHLFIVY